MSKVRLYDPKGTPFNVRPDLVAKLKLDHGWTANRPVPSDQAEDSNEDAQQLSRPEESEEADADSSETVYAPFGSETEDEGSRGSEVKTSRSRRKK